MVGGDLPTDFQGIRYHGTSICALSSILETRELRPVRCNRRCPERRSFGFKAFAAELDAAEFWSQWTDIGLWINRCYHTHCCIFANCIAVVKDNGTLASSEPLHVYACIVQVRTEKELYRNGFFYESVYT